MSRPYRSRCRKCNAELAWFGDPTDRPACDKCGRDVPESDVRVASSSQDPLLAHSVAEPDDGLGYYVWVCHTGWRDVTAFQALRARAANQHVVRADRPPPYQPEKLPQSPVFVSKRPRRKPI